LQIKTKIVSSQNSQTGGQQYSDTSPFSIPWFNNRDFGAKRRDL